MSSTTTTIVIVISVLVIILVLGLLLGKLRGSTEDLKIEHEEGLLKEITFTKTYSEKKDTEIRFEYYSDHIVICKLEFTTRTPIITRYRFNVVDFVEVKKEDFIDLEQSYFVEVVTKHMEQSLNSISNYKDKNNNVFSYRFNNILFSKKELFLDKLVEAIEEIKDTLDRYQKSLIEDKRTKEEKIKELDELLSKGSINLEEYEKAKHDILIG